MTLVDTLLAKLDVEPRDVLVVRATAWWFFHMARTHCTASFSDASDWHLTAACVFLACKCASAHNGCHSAEYKPPPMGTEDPVAARERMLALENLLIRHVLLPSGDEDEAFAPYMHLVNQQQGFARAHTHVQVAMAALNTAVARGLGVTHAPHHLAAAAWMLGLQLVDNSTLVQTQDMHVRDAWTELVACISSAHQ